MVMSFEIRKKAMTLERPFGGLNVVTSGDAWQFGPIGSNAVYDNYNKLPKRASVQTIAAMFWKHELDSFNCFRELTVERRCKDPWSQVLYCQRFNFTRMLVVCKFDILAPKWWEKQRHHDWGARTNFFCCRQNMYPHWFQSQLQDMFDDVNVCYQFGLRFSETAIERRNRERV